MGATPLATAQESREQTIYRQVEQMFREEYEAGLDGLPAEVQNDPAIRGLAVKIWQMVIYNKANIYVSCRVSTLDLLGAKEITPELAPEQLKKCTNNLLAHVITFNKLAGDASSIPASVSGMCEKKSRLFAREMLLPPYAFLKPNGTELYDFETFNSCLLSAAPIR